MKRIRCPIHNHIQLDSEVLPIIDLPVFQRLRGIKQLGMANLVYPGAQHSRFEHSLGVFHLGDSVAEILGLSEKDHRIITLSGLLHDIGHGPFSHIMESVSDLTHEERGREIILNSEISDLISGMGIVPREISDTILGESKYSPLISSEIDIDRMDYLLRDAHYTGVSTALDSGRLAAVMDFQDGRLSFKEAGLGAVEALLLARFMMYPYVYYHHTARSAERMMTRAIEILIPLIVQGNGSNGKDLRSEGWKIVHKNDPIQEGLEKDRKGVTLQRIKENGMEEFGIEEFFWQLDDIELVALLRGSGGKSGFLMKAIDERKLFKRGWELSLSQLLETINDGQSTKNFMEMLRNYLSGERIKEIEEEIGTILGIDPEFVIFDCPLPPELNTQNINIRCRGGEIVPARSLSQIISIMEKAQLDHWKFRVYVPEKYRDEALTELKERMQDLLLG